MSVPLNRWLPAEAALIREDVAFGIIGSVATLQSRVFLLKHWWLPGAQGCLYVERGLAPNIERKVGRSAHFELYRYSCLRITVKGVSLFPLAQTLYCVHSNSHTEEAFTSYLLLLSFAIFIGSTRPFALLHARRLENETLVRLYTK